jgi:hypothetical protein
MSDAKPEPDIDRLETLYEQEGGSLRAVAQRDDVDLSLRQIQYRLNRAGVRRPSRRLASKIRQADPDDLDLGGDRDE